MGISLCTKKGNSITNETYTQKPDDFVQYMNAQYKRDYPDAIFRSGCDESYNCHGLTFANRRTCIEDPGELSKILEDDGYRKISSSSVMPGDIIIYRDEDGEITHTGLVVGIKEGSLINTPLILSKWGTGPEFLHKYNYAPQYYLRCDKEFWTERDADE